MQKIDSDTLTVIDQIKRFHTEMSSEVGEVGNIFLVFAHDLVVHFSGILIQREAQEHYADNVSFPYINKQYAISPYRVGTAGFQSPMADHGLKTHLRRLPLSHVAVGEALPFGYRQDSMVANDYADMERLRDQVIEARLAKRREIADAAIRAVLEKHAEDQAVGRAKMN